MHRLFGGAAPRRAWLIAVGLLLGAAAGVLVTIAVTGPSLAEHRPPTGEPPARVSTSTEPVPSTTAPTSPQPVSSSADPAPPVEPPADVPAQAEPVNEEPAPPAQPAPAPSSVAPPAVTTTAPTATPCLEGEISPDCLDDGLHNGSA